ncbi:MAG: tRNA-specific 2-thiouridylase, partial [Erysipelotrichaceae bacterium]|nr:tRNA-specific 2-thiouridylase [Erysipelotrichaceae bacterium]
MKVLLGLSGGVDSAVAGKILIDQGFEVTALFMRNWDSAINNDYLGNPTLTDDICPQEDDYNDALKVADQLGIELLRQDYIKEYWDLVFKKFIDEYEKGRTPNPDILCNKYIKFDTFYDYAKEHGFDALATGHYVKKVEHNDGFALAKADDLNKDQSYFLSEISNEAMKYSIFPLGN